MQISKVTLSPRLYSKPAISFKNTALAKQEENNKKPDDEKMKTSTKALIAVVGAAAVSAAVYLAGKNHLLGDGLYNLFNKEGSRVNPSTLPVNSQNAAIPVADKIDYEIMPAAYDKSVPTEEDGSLFRRYQSVIENMRSDERTSQRLDEVLRSLVEDYCNLNNKVAETLGEIADSTPEDFGTYVFCHDIAKTRYFSIPENKMDGYCCLDPLLYQKAREEIVDVHLGYNLMAELNQNTESQFLNVMRQACGSKISKEDNNFIDSCVAKLLPEDAICHGNNSVLHTYELIRVGKIFREAIGVPIR